MKKIITLNQNEINSVSCGTASFVLENQQDTNNTYPGHKVAVAKVAIVACITAAVVVLIYKIDYCSNNQLREGESYLPAKTIELKKYIESYLPTKSFELMMYSRLRH